MTKGKKGITDMLNIPHLDDVLKEQGIEITPEDDQDEDDAQTVSMIKNLEEVLKTDGSDIHTRSMEEVYKETLQHSRDLMDLAYNVDERSRRGILEIATSMYKNALDAKNSQRDAQLKLMKLIQDQRKQDFEERKWHTERGTQLDVGNDVTIVADRNEIIRKAMEEAKKKAP